MKLSASRHRQKDGIVVNKNRNNFRTKTNSNTELKNNLLIIILNC